MTMVTTQQNAVHDLTYTGEQIKRYLDSICVIKNVIDALNSITKNLGLKGNEIKISHMGEIKTKLEFCYSIVGQPEGVLKYGDRNETNNRSVSAHELLFIKEFAIGIICSIHWSMEYFEFDKDQFILKAYLPISSKLLEKTLSPEIDANTKSHVINAKYKSEEQLPSGLTVKCPKGLTLITNPTVAKFYEIIPLHVMWNLIDTYQNDKKIDEHVANNLKNYLHIAFMDLILV